MIQLDGSLGEGGGQILRTALALSALTASPFGITGIRAGRARPGLMRQHLASVEAARDVCGADVDGGFLGSTSLRFRPGSVRSCDLVVDLQGAGSTSLVLHTVLPPLLAADRPSSIVLRGGTHNPSAPPAPHLERVFAPWVRRLGAGLEVQLTRPGFYPAGGGELRVSLTPGRLTPPVALTRGGPVSVRPVALVSAVRASVAKREVDWVRRGLGLRESVGEVRSVGDPRGPGNVVWVELDFPTGSEVMSAFGERGVSAEEVAERVVQETRAFLAEDVPVGDHTADQLLLLAALAGEGVFRTLEPTLHARTNAEVITRFLPVSTRMTQDGSTWVTEVGPA